MADERNCNECGGPVMYGERHSHCGVVAMKYQKQIDKLQRDLDQAIEAIAILNAGEPLGEIVGIHVAQSALSRVEQLELLVIRLYCDLPTNRDWLDPVLERQMKDVNDGIR